MTRRILVTGGFGYVGGRIGQRLSSEGDVALHLGSRSARSAPDWAPGAKVIAMEWGSAERLEAACEGVEAVVHLAAMNEIEAARDPAGALEVNGVYTARLLEAAVAVGVSRFVYLSTAHVYGSPLTGRLDELSCPRPAHPYATSHRAAEDVVLAAHAAERLVGLVLRLSNGFGAPADAGVDRWTLLVNDLCRQAATDRRLVLRSAGLQRRDFVPLSDVARACSHMLRIARSAAGDGLFNVGGAWAPKVIELAEIIQARTLVVLGFTPEIVRPDPAPGEATLDLDYRIDKLLATGFALAGDAASEIDATLQLCARASE